MPNLMAHLIDASGDEHDLGKYREPSGDPVVHTDAQTLSLEDEDIDQWSQELLARSEAQGDGSAGVPPSI